MENRAAEDGGSCIKKKWKERLRTTVELSTSKSDNFAEE